MSDLNRYNLLNVVLMLSIGAMLCACSSSGRVTPQAVDGSLVWPPAPSAPRVEYIGSLSNPEDLGIGKGLFGLMKEVATGKVDESMVLPMAVVENGKGQLFVADPGRKAIHRFDTQQGRYRLIKRGESGKDFESPVAMAADRDGNVYIADSELAKVFVIPINDDKAKPLPLEEDFIRPTGIAIDNESGWIYVVDTGLHAVYIFGQNNALIRKFGHRGMNEGEFNFPTYIWQNNAGTLLVTDSLNFRIELFDRQGQYIGQFGKAGNATGDLSRPKGVAEDGYGHVYVSDALFHNVQMFDESGKFLLHFGVQGNGPGEFWLPAGLFVSDEGTIYVSDSYNKRVQMFRYIGEE